jgi:hypothetical protein
MRKAAPDPVVVEALVDVMRENRSCSIAQRLHDVYGREAVAAAHRQYHALLRRELRMLRRQVKQARAAYLKRQSV